MQLRLQGVKDVPNDGDQQERLLCVPETARKQPRAAPKGNAGMHTADSRGKP